MNVNGDFPILKSSNNKNLIYLDSAATTLKPQKVIDTVNEFYNELTSNVFRGAHVNSEKVSIKFDNVRKKVAYYINANYEEIIFTHNATDAINKLSEMLDIKDDDIIVNSILEHHSNYLPWRMKGKLISVGIDSRGNIDINELKDILDKNNVKLVAITMVSNVTGNVQPIKQIVSLCKEKGVLTLVDASQAVSHMKISVKDVGCDFMAFSGHKMLSPSGVGVLYVSKGQIDSLSIPQFGGGMVDKITDSSIKYKSAPYCFEAGTPAIESVLGLGAAIDYINSIGIENIEKHMFELSDYFIEKIKDCDFIKMPFAISGKHVPIFTILPSNNKMDIKYISRILSDSYGIAVNAGYQCCQPLYNFFNLHGGIRMSLYIYNDKRDIDAVVAALEDIKYLLK